MVKKNLIEKTVYKFFKFIQRYLNIIFKKFNKSSFWVKLPDKYSKGKLFTAHILTSLSLFYL